MMDALPSASSLSASSFVARMRAPFKKVERPILTSLARMRMFVSMTGA
nr:MAG TPA: hypothetical protein [Caudoviricetes sp.]